MTDLLDAAPGPGLKYKAALSIGYGAGLRANEVVNLKLGDIDSDGMLIRVEQSLPPARSGVLLGHAKLSTTAQYSPLFSA